MPSPRFDSLISQLAWLRKHLLPYKFDPTGAYVFADRVAIRASAYRVLSHAEFESYVEARVLQVARLALQKWKEDGVHSAPLSSILAFCDLKMPNPPDYVEKRPKDQKDWDDLISPNQRIERAVSNFVDFVESDNHGIREKNLTKLLIPISVDLRQIKATDLATIDDFGRMRGNAAHNSAMTYVKSGVDPKTEFDRVSDVARSFEQIDTLIDRALSVFGT